MKIMSNLKGRTIGYFDCHVPHNIDFTPVLAFQKTFNPNYIIVGGDFVNAEFCSHWNESLFKEIGFGKLRHNILGEFAAATELLTRIREASPKAKIFFLPGNHEAHVFWAAQYFPALGIDTHIDVRKINFKSDMALAGDIALGLILEDMLHTEDLDITVLPYNEPLQIGKVMYLHGHQLTSANSPRLYPNHNVIYGHYHGETCCTLNDNGDGQAVQHRMIPCMTNLGPKKPGYLASKSTRWLNGFWVCDTLANGLFDGRVKKVLGGKILIP